MHMSKVSNRNPLHQVLATVKVTIVITGVEVVTIMGTNIIAIMVITVVEVGEATETTNLTIGGDFCEYIAS